MRPALIAIGCGLVASLFFLSMLTGSPAALLLVYFAQLPLFVAGLWLGATGGLIAAVCATVATAIGGLSSVSLLFLALQAAPAALLTSQAMRVRRDAEGRAHWYPVSFLVGWLIAMGATALFAAAFLASDAPGGLEGQIIAGLRPAFDFAVRFGIVQADTPEALDLLTRIVARFFPAMLTVTWLVLTALNGIIAQGVLARFGVNARPSPSMVEVELPSWAPALLAVAAVLAFLASGTVGYLALNLLLVIVLWFFFGGLAVVHAMVRRVSAGPALLAGIYVVIVAFEWPILLVAALGLIEQWAGLRARFARAIAAKETANG